MEQGHGIMEYRRKDLFLRKGWLLFAIGAVISGVGWVLTPVTKLGDVSASEFYMGMLCCFIGAGLIVCGVALAVFGTPHKPQN
jgi:hypothetical protein